MITRENLILAFEEANANSEEFDPNGEGGHGSIIRTGVDEDTAIGFAKGRARAWMLMNAPEEADMETALAALCLEGLLIGIRAARMEAQR